MSALIPHTLFHYYEANMIQIGTVFRIHEAELEDGMLILVIIHFNLLIKRDYVYNWDWDFWKSMLLFLTIIYYIYRNDWST